jgi:hypothetical protein
VENLAVVVSLGLFIALAAAFLFVLRRAAGVVAVTREDDSFRRDAAALAERAAASIQGGAERIDRVRRRQDAPAMLDDVLPPLQEALAGLRAEADALAPPAALAPLRERIAGELDRAGRAVATVEHGCALLSVTARRPSEVEGETSVKRGYLNLLHAREALVAVAIDLRSGRMDAQRWFSDRPKAG